MSEAATAPTSTLCACGFADSSPAPRCKVCPHAPSALAGPAGAPEFGARRGAPRPPTAEPVRHSRWAKSHTSFGPTGRVVATVLLLLPLVVFAFTLASGVGIVGAGIWLFVVMPLGLRDIWKKAPLTGVGRRAG